MKQALRRVIFGYVSLFSLVLNMLQPLAYASILVSPVHAEEVATESATIATPTPTPTPTPTATATPSASPVESASPIATTIAEAVAVPTPTSTPVELASPSSTPTPSPLDIDTNAKTLNIVVIPDTAANSINEFDLTITESGSATIATDKTDYAPTDAAIITGSGYVIGATYTLTIWSDDEPVTKTTTDVVSDTAGNIISTYQLDGNYRPNYSVEVTNEYGKVVATTTFNDHDCNPPTPKGTITIVKDVPGTDPQDFTFTASNNLGNFTLDDDGSNSTNGSGHYSNNKVFSDKNIGTYTFSETNMPSGWRFDNVSCTGATSYTTGDASVTINLANSENVVCTFINTKNAVPVLKIIKHVINNNGGTADASDFWMRITNAGMIHEFTGSEAGATITLQPGAFTATEFGGPSGYAMSETGTCSGTLKFGDNVTCTLINDDIPGTLVVNKVVASGNKTPSQFSFSVNHGSATHFNSNGQNSLSVNAGTYDVTEISDPDYQGSYDNCSHLNIGLGETKSCTITNSRKTGKVLIDKILFGVGSAKETDWDFAISGITGTFKDGSYVTLNTGSFTITESGSVLGYSLTDVGGACSNKNGNSATLTVNPTSGDAYQTCSFTNTRDTGSVKVNKKTDLNGDGDYYDHDETSNSKANVLGFRWSLDNGESNHMGDTQSGIETTIVGGVDHFVSENSVNGYHYVGYSLSGDCNHPTTPATIPVTITKNHTTELTLCNAKDMGTITIVKDATPNDGRDFHFDSNIPNLGDFELKDDGHHSNSITRTVAAGTYSVTEHSSDGWYLSSLSCNDDDSTTSLESHRANLSLSAGEHITCTFTNTKYGKIEGAKYQDKNGNGIRDRDENGISGWSISLSNDLTTHTNGSGTYEFDNLIPGQYTVCEESRDGWYSKNQSCQTTTITAGDTDEITFGNYQKATITVKKDVVRPDGSPVVDNRNGFTFHFSGSEEAFILYDQDGGESNYRAFTVDPGSYSLAEDPNTNYDFAGCKFVDSETILNSLTLSSGDNLSVVCTNKQKIKPILTLTKSNNASGDKAPGDSVIYTLVVKLMGSDLTNVTVTDLPPHGFVYRLGSWTASSHVTSEPTYHGPGTWYLGDMHVGDEVTLRYTADIDSSTDSGKYPDLAWAQGTSVGGWGTILDNQDTEPVTFVSTSVSVNRGESIATNVNIEKTGEVLGAATELPATGADNRYIILIGAFAFIGLTLTFGKKSMKKLLTLAIFLLGFGLFACPTFAYDDPALAVKLTELKSPTRYQDQKLGFTVLDTNNVGVNVSCYKKSPSDSNFVEFGAAQNLAVGGSSGYCQTNSSVIGDRGTYEFYVTADAGNGVEESNHVSLVFDNQSPAAPSGYSKDHASSCRYILHFHTSNNGQTARVEIYRSLDKTFTADAGSRVGSLDIEADKDGTYTDNLADQCDKDWFYAIRAFDAAGNGSDIAGDIITVNTVINQTTAKPTIGAIPVSGNVLGKSAVGEVLGDDQVNTTPADTSHSIPAASVSHTSKWIIILLVALALSAAYTIYYVQVTRRK